MDGLLAIDDGENAADQIVAFVVGQLTQVHRAGAQMVRLVRITTGATQGAFAGDFNGESWLLAGENAGPGVQHFGFLHSGSSGETTTCSPYDIELSLRGGEFRLRSGMSGWAWCCLR